HHAARGVCPSARAVHREPLPLAGHRTRHLPRLPGSHRLDARWRNHGGETQDAGHRRRAVSPRKHPYRTWPRHAQELPGAKIMSPHNPPLRGSLPPEGADPAWGGPAPDRMTLVDLRSDTVTQPTAAMREAMMAAPLGDDVFGDDPSVNALQEHIAAITGKEAALFMSSGTQSNLCGMMAHCGRGDEYIVGQNAHTYRYEGGGAAVLGSIQPQPLAQDEQGLMKLSDVLAAIKPDDPHFARTRLLCLENTWHGHPMPAAYLARRTDLAR